MKATLSSSIIALLIFSVLLLVSCGEKRTEPVATAQLFEVPLNLSHQPHVQLRADINGDGVEDAVIVVRDSLVRSHRQDSVHLFLWHPTDKQFKQVCVFALEDFETGQLLDLQRSGHMDLVVFTNTGGSSGTASRGLELYRFNAPCFSKTLSVDYGNPSLFKLDSQTVIVQNQELSSFVSRSESVEYADSVIVPFSASSEQQRELRLAFFEQYSNRQQVIADSVFHHATQRHQLHRQSFEATVRRIMALKKIGKIEDAKASSRQLLQRIPSLPAEYKDMLKEFLDSAL